MQSIYQFLRPSLAALILVFVAPGGLLAEEAVTEAPLEASEEEPQGLLPLNDLRTFTEIFDRIKRAYIEEVDDKTLFENAIQGLLQGLDPHSSYLEKDAFDDLQVNTKGEFGGLGIEVEMEDGFVKVVAPIDDTPAAKAGVLSMDLIVKIDNQPVKGMTLQNAVELMRGKPGTKILLTIVREGESGPLDIELTRAAIKVASVRTRNLGEGFGYIRISQFQVNTGDDLRDALEKLNEEHDSLKGLVLDLRNNPGGVLNAAVEVSDAFLTEGLIVYTSGRLPSSELRYNATEDDPSAGLPTVVLINGGSASASEIVAGALQDNNRAIILGTQSFGKGSVQTVLPLNNDRALKLTTALYYTPSGRSIQAEGVIPDLVIENAKVTPLKTRSLRFKESDLRGHLTNGNADDDDKKGNKKDKKAKDKKTSDNKKDTEAPVNLAEKDFQLYEALNLLKGINIIGH